MSGFKKKTATKGPTIPGTAISPKSLQLLTSSGIKSLDNLINGGLPVGTVVLFEDNLTRSINSTEEGTKTNYSKVLISHFLEEGLSNKHKLFIGSCAEKFTFTPIISNAKEQQINPDEENEISASNETLRIAWRYRNQMPSENNDTETSLQIARSKNVSLEKNDTLDKESLSTWHITDIDSSVLFKKDVYQELFKSVYETCSAPNLTLETLSYNAQTSAPNLIRIGLVDIASLTCNDEDTRGIKVSGLNRLIN